MSRFQQKEFVIPSPEEMMISPTGSQTSSREYGLAAPSAYQSSIDSNEAKSPRFPSLTNLNFLKASSEKKTKEGQAPKRRGPKPDSKPALNRRQELNRQAQRTHRERKEVYIKALEGEVLRLKEAWSTSVKEKNLYSHENRRLKELLQVNGIHFHSAIPQANQRNNGLPTNNYAPTSFSGSQGHRPSISPGTTTTTTASPFNLPPRKDSVNTSAHGLSPANSLAPALMTPNGNSQTYPRTGQNGRSPSSVEYAGLPNIDHEQVGIDFVLALEESCGDHAHYMVQRSRKPGEDISGHVLMATCPPLKHVAQYPLPDTYNLGDPVEPTNHLDLPKADLLKLFDLSQSLELLQGEITPVVALKIIREDSRYPLLGMKEFEALKDELRGKTRCYGFGAALEEFEVRDALDHVLASRYGS